MNNSEMQNMIEKYKRELIEYAQRNDGYIAEMPEEPVQNESSEMMRPQTAPVQPENSNQNEITELTGTNPEGYVSDRVDPPYDTYDDFVQNNPGKGYLKVQTFSGRESFPIANANVVVSKTLTSREQSIYDEYTDISGVVDNLELNAPSKSLSEEPNNSIPYATYNVRVTHPYFITTIYKNLPIFDSIKSIQNVAMVPRTGTPADDRDIVYDETSNKDL